MCWGEFQDMRFNKQRVCSLHAGVDGTPFQDAHLLLENDCAWSRLPPGCVYPPRLDPRLMTDATSGYIAVGWYWERHCEHNHMIYCGFVPIETWSSMLVNEKLKCLVMVHVDDFKIDGPSSGLKKAWTRIPAGIETDDTGEVGKCLGCVHRSSKGTIPRQDPCTLAGRVAANIMEYGVASVVHDCVTAYKGACSEPDIVLKKVDTPCHSVLRWGGGGGGDAHTALEEANHRGFSADRLFYRNEESLRS